MTMTRPTDEGRTEQPALSALSAAVGAELGAGAADVVGIGVGSPVARLGAHGQRRREARGGRSPRSRSRRCSLRTRCRAAVVAEGVGGVETRPLARPPKGTQKKSFDAAVA
jgi:hypothetical protein